MKTERILLVCAAVAMTGAGVASRAQMPTRSVWSGVYTAEQAARGKAQYEQNCAACHGGMLMGGDSAPTLVGGPFLNNWNSTSAADLHERIKTTMPPGDPGGLNVRTVADIESYIFQTNGFPAGDVELPPSPQMLAGVKIQATKPTD